MTQKDKQVLVTNLCARLVYGVNVDNTLMELLVEKLNGSDIDNLSTKRTICVKPYLRPSFSMTDEERKEYNNTFIELLDEEYLSKRKRTVDWLKIKMSDYLLEQN